MQMNMDVMKSGKKSEGENKNRKIQRRVQVLRSLRRSRVRTEVAMHLYKIYPAASYPADIARNTGIAPTSILGALRGMGNGFAGTKSLLVLGLAAKIEDDGAAYYRLTEQGKSVMDEVAIYDNT